MAKISKLSGGAMRKEFAKAKPKLERSLGVLKQERIYAMMGVGRPSVRFRNKVAGKSLRLSWNGRQD